MVSLRAELRAYNDENSFVFRANGVYISDSFGYSHMEEMLACANAPVVKPDSDVVIAIVDSRQSGLFKPIVLHTSKKVSPHTTHPISFDEDSEEYHNYVEAMIYVSKMALSE